MINVAQLNLAMYLIMMELLNDDDDNEVGKDL